MPRYYKQMSYSKIARALKRQLLPTVRVAIFRAKEQLRRNLRREQSVFEASAKAIR